MYTIRMLNNIAEVGLNRLPKDRFEISSDSDKPDAILLRSHDMHGMELPESILAVARAGAGVNNIPVDACTERGIVVFNTPGANANSVKELVLAGLFLTSRRIVEGITWARSLQGSGKEVPALVEKGKNQFVGPEIQGKTLGVIGLGAVGVLVANGAAALGMEVVGYDPFISVESAWGISNKVARTSELESLISRADYISLHLPLNEKTEGFIDAAAFAAAKKGVRILNFARGALVKTPDLQRALDDGVVARYATDFPDEELLSHENVIPIPHLGASTPEAEDNCAVMAVDQLVEFLSCGNIRNSVNFPDCDMVFAGDTRIVISNRNIPNMVGQITTILAKRGLNISDMLNRHQDGYAYTIIDVEGDISDTTTKKLRGIEGVSMVRVIHNRK